MPKTMSRARVVAAGASLMALVALTGCNNEEAPSAAAPSQAAPATGTSEPTPSDAGPTETDSPSEPESPQPTASASPEESATSEPAAPATDAPAAKKGLTKPGSTLKVGETANVEIEYAGTSWIGGLTVTGFEKAPKSDYADLGIRGDAGNVYYLRYDVTYLAGKTKYPPEGGQISWVRLHPAVTPGQQVSLINNPGFKKCSTVVYDSDKAKLQLGDTAQDMCLPFVVKKGTLHDVVHSVYNDQTNQDEVITWKG